MTKKVWQPHLVKGQKGCVSFLSESNAKTTYCDQPFVITNVECIDQEDLIHMIADAIKVKRGQATAQWFVHLSTSIRYKANVLAVAKEFILIACQDAVETCLYCGEKLEKEALYCDMLCAELAKES